MKNIILGILLLVAGVATYRFNEPVAIFWLCCAAHWFNKHTEARD